MKFLKVTNKKKFKKCLMNLGSYGEISKKIGVAKSNIPKWLNGTMPKSDNLKKLIDVYKLTYEELGVSEVDDGSDKCIVTFRERLNELIQLNYKENKEQFLKEYGCSESDFKRLIKYDRFTKLEKVQDLATFFDVSTSYLLGLTNNVSIDDGDIIKLLNYDNKEIENLINLDLYNWLDYDKDYKDDSKPGVWLKMKTEKANDFLHYLLKDTELLDTFKFSVSRIIDIYKDNKSSNDFNLLFNPIETYNETFKNIYDIREVFFTGLTQKLWRLYNSYIDGSLEKLGIDVNANPRDDIYREREQLLKNMRIEYKNSIKDYKNEE